MPDDFVINLLDGHPEWLGVAVRFEDAVRSVVRKAGARLPPGRRLQCARRANAVEFGPFRSADGDLLWARGSTPEDLAESLRHLLDAVPAFAR